MSLFLTGEETGKWWSPGDVIEDPAFISATLAFKYAWYGGALRTIFEIHNISGLKVLMENAAECEVLIAGYKQWRVVGVGTGIDGIDQYVIVEALQRGDDRRPSDVDGIRERSLYRYVGHLGPEMFAIDQEADGRSLYASMTSEGLPGRDGRLPPGSYSSEQERSALARGRLSASVGAWYTSADGTPRHMDGVPLSAEEHRRRVLMRKAWRAYSDTGDESLLRELGIFGE